MSLGWRPAARGTYYWRCNNGPFGGEYFVKSPGDLTTWTWRSCEISASPQGGCTFLALLFSAALAAQISLPVSTSVECQFGKGSGTSTFLGITFGVQSLHQAYDLGLPMVPETLPQPRLLRRFQRDHVSLEVVRQWLIDCQT
ncbi:hypothetical protein BDU57DRAFT_516965 [Ampelomyces quisqualis]|uniref:Uncharacterized protein n=1 Tax=Ampelomyces quisqualis TaxID=50730 RepID=A0A6A5QM78_AMPQU|nr:hypothetical protein BDU57DRAFT_516965 [Ampelomyces quisqualis]